jgi:FAD/FMN-containing dehydrogenase
MRGLNSVQIDEESSTITVGGGTIIEEVVATADAAGYRVPTGNCNGVGIMGAILGGGVGLFQGLYGLGVDNIVSMHVVTGDGQLRMIDSKSSDDADLWWAMRGAGPNFGVVTKATLNAYKESDRSVWSGPVVFAENKIEDIVTAIDQLNLTDEMAIFLYFATSGSPKYTPIVIVSPFYAGSETTGRAAFGSIFNIGPTQDNTAVLPYTSANVANDAHCAKGGRKPSYGVSMGKLDPQTWRSIWKLYVEYVSDTRVANSSVFVECYSWSKARQLPTDSSSFPFRDTSTYIGLVNNVYIDPSLDSKAQTFGNQVRDLWRSTDGLAQNST